ncbi:MAG: MBL fold metallo-hydrolase [Desulfobacteria bacterium]
MLTPPLKEEIEISIFGPGYGECILVHIGFNDWIIIDSCISPSSKEPCAIEYLSSIGVPLDTGVKLVVATHWHDDHIRGIGKTVNSCSNATFVCSDGLLTKEFVTFIKAYGARSGLTEGVNEFDIVLKSLETSHRTPKYASAEKALWKRKGPNFKPPCCITALSPADFAIHLAKIQLKELFPQENITKRDVVAPQPNNVAVVIWVEVGDICLLLGSDLENSPDKRHGWAAIVDSNLRPRGIASVFKIPHHGSKNADLPEVWQNMLIKNPLAVMTPFSKGNVSLPTLEDINRIKSQTSEAYITALPRVKHIKKPKIVEQFVKGATKSIYQVNSFFGHARFRADLKSQPIDWKTELFQSATSLNSLKG